MGLHVGNRFGSRAAIIFVSAIMLVQFVPGLTEETEGAKSSATIQGWVWERDTLERIGGALVEVVELGLYAYTSPDGNFSIANVPYGVYKMKASADGFTSDVQIVMVTTGNLFFIFSLAEALYDWTYMLYWDFDNNLDGWWQHYSESVRLGANPTSRVKVIALVDRSQNWLDGSNSSARVYEFHNYSMTLVLQMGEADMGCGDTLRDFVTWTVETYPAERFALGIFNHGNAWHGLCSDYTPAGFMSLDELESAASDIEYTARATFEVIDFDCCLMQMIEVAHVLRDYTMFVVGSEDDVWGQDYVGTISNLTTNPDMNGLSFAQLRVQQFALWYVGDYVNGTCSAIDTKYLVRLNGALNTLAGTLYELLATSRTKIVAARESTEEFDEHATGEYVDLTHFVENIQSAKLSTDKTYLGAIRSILTYMESMVVAEYHFGWNTLYAHGLAIWFPSDSATAANLITYDTQAFIDDSLGSVPNWSRFLHNYHQI